MKIRVLGLVLLVAVLASTFMPSVFADNNASNNPPATSDGNNNNNPPKTSGNNGDPNPGDQGQPGQNGNSGHP